MTENLKLIGPKTLTSTDSNVTYSFALTASNSGTWCTTNSSACVDQPMVLDSGSATYGTYYNWYAATAGTGTYSMTSGNATSSICSKGWRLPTGGSSGEFQTLYSNYNSSALMRGDPAAFVLSGRRDGNSTDGQGDFCNFWASTAGDSNFAYYLSLNSSNVGPAGVHYRHNGLTVRCVAQ